jgi:putative ABC transport system ATP-binding protein
VSDPVVQLSGVSREYRTPAERVIALHPTDLSVAPRELLGVSGASGSGKTTLLHLVGLLLTPTTGELRLLGRDVAAAGENERGELRRTSVGLVFQEPLLVSHLDVLANVHLWRPGISHEECRALLERLGVAELERRRPAELSGGQQQRVALARALAGAPALLVADEPTASLDDDNAAVVAQELVHHVEAGGAVVLASHDPRVLDVATRIVSLDRGRLAEAAA